ncbi:MAG: hypothetical protein WDZ26_02875, partial [Nitriliruptoraceae bacterium]
MTDVVGVDRVDVTLADARPTDADRLAALSRTASRSPWSVDLLTADLCRTDRSWILATAPDGDVVGLAGIADLAGSAHVLD